jgi:PAS domain S-box-containing protein
VRRVHPEDRERTERQFIEAVRGDAREYRSEYRIVRPRDGEVRWIQVRSEIERGPDGKPLRLVGAHIDITDRKRAELALQTLNETLEQQVAERTRERDRLWRVSDDLIGVANFEGHWVSINPAATAILGWSQSELLAMPIASLWHPDEASDTLKHRQRLVEGGPTERFQNRYRHKDGSYRWLAWSSTAEGGFIYALGRDVTSEHEAADALRRTEEQLRQAQKMEAVGQLTGGIAHDFNNLLTGILGSLDLMQKRVAQGRLGDIERYATMPGPGEPCSVLTHRSLARAPPAARSQARQRQSTRHFMEDLLRRSIGERSGLKSSSGAVRARSGSASTSESALLNSAINARDATPDGGRLTIETANAPRHRYAAELRRSRPICRARSPTASSAAARARLIRSSRPSRSGRAGLGLSMVMDLPASPKAARIYPSGVARPPKR